MSNMDDLLFGTREQSPMVQVPEPGDIWRELGITAPGERNDDDRTNALQSLLAGVATGIYEPFSFLPEARKALDAVEPYRDSSTTVGKIGYGLGFLAGFAIPGTAAFRASEGLLQGTRLFRAADMAVDASKAYLLARGAIAGALTTVGAPADDPSERIRNVFAGAAIGGVGDVAVMSAFKALSGATVLGSVEESVAQQVVREVAEDNVVTNLNTATLLGRAINMADEFVDRQLAPKPKTSFRLSELQQLATDIDVNPAQLHAAAQTSLDTVQERLKGNLPTNVRTLYERMLRTAEEQALPAPADELTGMRKLRLRLGLEELGVEDLTPGMVRIVPHVSGPIDDMRRVLQAQPDIDFAFARYRSSLRGGNEVVDAVIGPKGTLNRDIITQFEEFGFIPGQSAVWKGKERIITGASKDQNYLLALSPGSKSNRVTPIPRSEVHLLPIATVEKGSMVGVDMNNLWLNFAKRYGPFPFKVTDRGEQGFEGAFQQFVGDNKLVGNANTIKRYFLDRQRKLLAEVDPDIEHTLRTLGNVKRAPHPEGQLEEMAAEKGYLVVNMPLNVPHTDGRTKWGYGIRDVETGETQTFESRALAREFLQSNQRQLKPAIESPVGEGLLADVETGAAVQVSHTAGEWSNVRVPWHVAAIEPVMPRAMFLRTMEDRLIKEMGDTAPRVWADGFEPISRGLAMSRKDSKPFFDRLTQIRGGYGRGTVRTEKYDEFLQMFESPQTEWPKLAADFGLNKAEVKTGRELRTLYNDLFDYLRSSGKVEVGGDDYIENYFPHVRRLSSRRWPKTLDQELQRQGKVVLPQTVQFVHEMERLGTLAKYEKDPFMVTLRYIRSAAFKVNVAEPWMKARDMVMSIPDGTPAEALKVSMGNYLKMVYGGQPEAYYTARVALQDLTEKLGIPLDEKSFDRMVNTMVTVNYGAFMGFRPGLAVRNMTQLFVTTLPYVGPKYLGKGMMAAMKGGRAAVQEALDTGALLTDAVAAPLEDAIYHTAIDAQVKSAIGRGVLGAARNVKVGAERLAAYSLSGTTKIAGRELPIPGVYSLSETVNRTVAYFAQKYKGMDALNAWKREGWSVEKFNNKSGLSQMGEAATRQFHQIYNSQGSQEAIKWLAVQVTNDTQFLYQTGAGPAGFSHGARRLFGMYGTWPSWYGAQLSRGLTKGTPADRARFAFWTSAVYASMLSAGSTVGINMSRWTGLSSFSWTGGPFFDAFKDLTDIVSGVDANGNPTMKRNLALGKRGIKENPGFNLDPREGHGFDIEDPQQLFWGTAAMFTPGSYALLDLIRAQEQPTDKMKMIRAVGLQPVAESWPEIGID